MGLLLTVDTSLSRSILARHTGAASEEIVPAERVFLLSAGRAGPPPAAAAAVYDIRQFEHIQNCIAQSVIVNLRLDLRFLCRLFDRMAASFPATVRRTHTMARTERTSGRPLLSAPAVGADASSASASAPPPAGRGVALTHTLIHPLTGPVREPGREIVRTAVPAPRVFPKTPTARARSAVPDAPAVPNAAAASAVPARRETARNAPGSPEARAAVSAATRAGGERRAGAFSWTARTMWAAPSEERAKRFFTAIFERMAGLSGAGGGKARRPAGEPAISGHDAAVRLAPAPGFAAPTPQQQVPVPAGTAVRMTGPPEWGGGETSRPRFSERAAGPADVLSAAPVRELLRGPAAGSSAQSVLSLPAERMLPPSPPFAAGTGSAVRGAGPGALARSAPVPANMDYPAARTLPPADLPLTRIAQKAAERMFPLGKTVPLPAAEARRRERVAERSFFVRTAEFPPPRTVRQVVPAERTLAPDGPPPAPPPVSEKPGAPESPAAGLPAPPAQLMPSAPSVPSVPLMPFAPPAPPAAAVLSGTAASHVPAIQQGRAWIQTDFRSATVIHRLAQGGAAPPSAVPQAGEETDIPTVRVRRSRSETQKTAAAYGYTAPGIRVQTQAESGEELAQEVARLLDIGQLSERVYRQIETRLRHEKMRRGMW